MKNRFTRNTLNFFEVYKYLNELSLDIINTIFKLKQNTYNLENFHPFQYQNPWTKKFGLDSIAYRASQLWENVPEGIRKPQPYFYSSKHQ